jgi:hypothetical protein
MRLDMTCLTCSFKAFVPIISALEVFFASCNSVIDLLQKPPITFSFLIVLNNNYLKSMITVKVLNECCIANRIKAAQILPFSFFVSHLDIIALDLNVYRYTFVLDIDPGFKLA